MGVEKWCGTNWATLTFFFFFNFVEFEESNITFLETKQGYLFVPVFMNLRMQYIISDLASARIIERDALIPSGKNKKNIMLWYGE